VLAGCPYDEFAAFRTDTEGNYFKTLDLAPEFARRVRSGKQVDRFAGTVNTANFFAGPMVLVGRWSEMPVIIRTLLPRRELRTAFAMPNSLRKQSAKVSPDYAHSPKRSPSMRRRAILPLCRCTSSRSSLQILPNRPPPEMRQLLYALRGNQTEANRFLGAWAGTVPIPEFFEPENIQRIVASQPI
jgi:hypothetical protein